ncbi:MAG: replicative DNA helicase [Candidatus Paceibacterota bacterium]|jgi:replicative DNA helicase
MSKDFNKNTQRSAPVLRVPPQSLDSEKAVLGSIMLRPGAVYEIADVLTPESFYADKHAMIYQSMLDLSNKNEPIDLISLSTKLKEKKILDNVGGTSYLTEISQTVPSSANIRHYAEIVYKKYTLRKLIEAADRVVELGFNEGDTHIDEILDEAGKKIYDVTSNQSKSQRFVHIKETLPEAWERLEKLHENKGELRGISTGFRDLDAMLSGFQESDLIILAARPSVGKTTLALDIARHAAVRHNIPVGIFSLEMSIQQLVDRMLAAESRVNAWNLRTGKLSADSEFSKLRESLDKFSKAPIFIYDKSATNIIQMRTIIRRLKAENGLGLVIVDYLQLMSTSKNYDSMVNQVTEISRSLKGLAKEFNVPVLALSQLSRAVEARGGKPRLSDLRDSGSIEQDADVVMFIHREDKGKEESEQTNIAEILIEKHRNGPVGRVELYFDKDKSTFLDLEKDDGYGKMARSKAGSLDDF